MNFLVTANLTRWNLDRFWVLQYWGSNSKHKMLILTYGFHNFLFVCLFKFCHYWHLLRAIINSLWSTNRDHSLSTWVYSAQLQTPDHKLVPINHGAVSCSAMSAPQKEQAEAGKTQVHISYLYTQLRTNERHCHGKKKTPNPQNPKNPKQNPNKNSKPTNKIINLRIV